MNEGGDLDKLGRGAIWHGEYSPCVHQNHVFVVRCSSEIEPYFLNIWASGAAARRYFLTAGKQTTNLASINKTSLGELPVVIPSSDEQRAIASTLSDIDNLLASLDRLIAKKRDLKQATMQQLLTGKKRLPGFGEGKGYQKTEIGVIPEDWKASSLGKITRYIKGFAFRSSDFTTQGTRVIRVSDTTFDLIKNDSEVFIDTKKAKSFDKWALREGDVIISTVGSKPPMYDSMVGKATFVDPKNENSLLNQNAVIIRAENWSLESQVFLHNHLKQPRYIEHIEKIFRGNANQASITLKELFSFLIPLPPTQGEQKAIAQVLTDMDTELITLQTRRTKTQALKQAMMQQLLTGKTRLITPTAQ